MALLLSGFGAFPGAPHNPTERLLAAVADRRDGALQTVCLPVEWDRAYPTLRAAIERGRPDRVLMTGLAVGADRIRIELLARRPERGDRADAAGRLRGAAADGPPVIEPVFPRRLFAEALRAADADFEWSTDAGDYLCNDVFYRLALDARALGVRQFAFVHVPLTDECLPDRIGEDWRATRFRTLPEAKLAAAVHSLVERWSEDASASV